MVAPAPLVGRSYRRLSKRATPGSIAATWDVNPVYSSAHVMRLLVAVLALCIACAVAHAQWSTGFDFVGNATDGENDPMGLLNYRYLQCLHCIDSRASYLRSLRSNDLDEPSSGAVDTLGALFSYGAIPSTFLAFWDRPAPWSNYSSETSSGTPS